MKYQAKIKWLEEVDSTNTQALREIDALDSLTVLSAFSQTAGRGQRGNSWLVRPGENLTFSIVLKFGPEGFSPLPAKRQFAISQATARGICGYLDSKGIEASIKWPNDIYIRNRKVCGVLIENSLQGEYLSYSIIGVGLNVNQKEFPPQLTNPTSMSIVSGIEYSVTEELPLLCKEIVDRLRMIEDSASALAEEYVGKLYRLGVESAFVDCSDGTGFEGRILGVDEAGLLIVETKNGELKKFAFKEISYVI